MKDDLISNSFYPFRKHFLRPSCKDTEIISLLQVLFFKKQQQQQPQQPYIPLPEKISSSRGEQKSVYMKQEYEVEFVLL
jgi:hypothetical protein